MMVAVNLYKETGRMWYSAELPDNICLYEANEAETIWGLNYFLYHEQCFYEEYLESCRECGWPIDENAVPQASGTQHLILDFIDKECSSREEGEWATGQLCRNMLMHAPDIIDEGEWDGLKNMVKQHVTKSCGLQFNRHRTEYYCYLLGVLMIASHDTDAYSRKHRIALFNENWNQLSWMYGIAIGRVLGTALHNFTAVIKQAGQNDRKHYLHLYLPLAERYIGKICSYGSDKRDRLQDAISKMKEVEEREEQRTDLDGLYAILFPKYITDALFASRPAGTIAELKDEMSAKDRRITELEKDIDDITGQYNKVLSQLAEAVGDVDTDKISAEELIEAFLRFQTDLALSIFGSMSTLLAQNATWQKYAPTIQQRILDKQREELHQERELKETMRMAAMKPTAIYQSGATHEDRRLQVISEGSTGDIKQIDGQ